MRAEGIWAHSWSLDSLGCTLGFVVFIRVRWVHSCERRGSLGSFGCALEVVRFIRGRWVHSGVPWWSLGSPGVVGFLWVLPGDRWVHPRGCVHSCVRPEYLWVQPGWLGSLWCVLDIVGLIRCR